MSGTINSNIKIDRKSGWIINSDIFQDIGGEVHLRMGDDMEDMVTQMTMKSNMVVTN